MQNLCRSSPLSALSGAEGVFWIGWWDLKKALLPVDGTPALTAQVDVRALGHILPEAGGPR